MTAEASEAATSAPFPTTRQGFLYGGSGFRLDLGFIRPDSFWIRRSEFLGIQDSLRIRRVEEYR